jgi:hypothetical protein
MPRFAVNITPIAASTSWDTGPLAASSADRITGGVFTDQSGTLFIEQSLDNGTTWDIYKSTPIVGGTALWFSEEVLVSPVRVRITNGATPQTVLRFKTNFQSAGARP